MLVVDGTHSVVVLHDFSIHTPSPSDAILEFDTDSQDSSSSSSSRELSGFAGTSEDDLVYVIDPLKAQGEEGEEGEGVMTEGEGWQRVDMVGDSEEEGEVVGVEGEGAEYFVDGRTDDDDGDGDSDGIDGASKGEEQEGEGDQSIDNQGDTATNDNNGDDDEDDGIPSSTT